VVGIYTEPAVDFNETSDVSCLLNFSSSQTKVKGVDGTNRPKSFEEVVSYSTCELLQTINLTSGCRCSSCHVMTILFLQGFQPKKL